MVIFGDKNSGKYVETEYSEVDRRMIIKWYNWPTAIVYYHHVHNEDQYVNLANWLSNILLMNNRDGTDIFQARQVLEDSFYKESVERSVDEIRALKNDAFDNINTSYMKDYWFGIFDALRWVLGDELEGFEYVSAD